MGETDISTWSICLIVDESETSTIYVLRPPVKKGADELYRTLIYVCDAIDETALNEYMRRVKVTAKDILCRFTGGDYWGAAKCLEQRLHQPRVFHQMLFRYKSPGGVFTKFGALAELHEREPAYLDDVLLDTCWSKK